MYRHWSLYVPPAVTICTATGHYVYRQRSLYVPPLVTICTATGPYMYRQRSLYVPPLVPICTATGPYMYRQRSLYVPPLVTMCTASGHYMYRQFNIQQFYVLPTQCIYRPFATTVSQLKIWHFWVIGIGRNVCRRAFNKYSVVTQFAKLAAGEQLCRRCTHRKL
jgi:hypothetical protein